MFLSRNLSKNLLEAQLDLRNLLLNLRIDGKRGLDGACSTLYELSATAARMRELVTGTYDEPLFDFLECFFSVIKFKATYLHQLRSGEPSSETAQKASNLHLGQLREIAVELSDLRPSILLLEALAGRISDISTVRQFLALLSEVSSLNLPFVDGIETDSLKDIRQHYEKQQSDEEALLTNPLLISVLLSTDNELWANPQVLKPRLQYAIRGTIKLNQLPHGYTKLTIRHVSTTSDELFILSLPEIALTESLEYQLDGHIVYKYPQNTFDPPITIKLLAQLQSDTEPPLYPMLIGYDELVAQVIDDTTFQYPTGYKKLNKKALEIALEIKKDLKHIEHEELEHFLVLFSAILNYAGYCAQYGIYKQGDNLSEDEFRDRLIAYLSSDRDLTSNIIKEGAIAGGRVEIRFHEIIAELKVERSISNRGKMIESYKRQPSAYASAVSAELAILCILDLTTKKLAPAIPASNVTLIPAVLHGFEEAPSTSKIAMIVIDGNLKNPSAY